MPEFCLAVYNKNILTVFVSGSCLLLNISYSGDLWAYRRRPINPLPRNLPQPA